MSRAPYSRAKDGREVYFCNGKRKDGADCGHRVSTPRGLCGVHRRQAEREWAERYAQKVARLTR